MDRARIIRALALSPAERLIELMESLCRLPAFEYLRAPRKGLIMVRAKADAKNQVFNLGEALVTRCSLSVSGFIGHSYILGDEPEKCLTAALADALAQDPSYQKKIEGIVLCLEEDLAGERDAELSKTKKTKV